MTTKPTTAPRMFWAHVGGILVGNALGVVVVVLAKRYLLPVLGLEESPMEKLADMIKDLPQPEPGDDMPPRVSRTSPKPPSGAGIGFGDPDDI